MTTRLARLGSRVLEREVALGWTAMLVPIPIIAVLTLGSYSGRVLPWLHEQFSLAWFCVFALAVTGFAGGYAATEPAPPGEGRGGRPPVIRRLGGARVLAVSLFCCCIYLLTVLAGFIPDPETSRRAAEATWWGIPFTLCFWTLAAIEIAIETERSGSGEPADPRRQWTWFRALRESAWAARASYVVLFGGTAAFAMVGSLPGVVWRTVSDQGLPTWQGHGFQPTFIYYAGFVLWACVLLLTAAVFLTHSFRARPAALPDAVLRRAWYSLWASGALVVLMALFALSARGWLSEPLVDVALALYVLCFVLMLVDASATTRHRRVKSGLSRRLVGASGTIGFAFGLPLIAGFPPFRAGLLAATLAGAVPLVPATLRALFGIQRQPVEEQAGDRYDEPDPALVTVPVPSDPAVRAALYALLVEGTHPNDSTPVDPGVLTVWQGSLQKLSSVALPEGRNIPNSHPLVFLLFSCDDGLQRTKKWPVPEKLLVPLERLFPGNLDEQKHGLIDLMRQTAIALTHTNMDSGQRTPPSAMEMLEAECVARLPHPPEHPGDRKQWKRLEDCRREWLFGSIVVWTGASQPVERSKLQGSYRQNHGAIRAQLLPKACKAVISWWLTNLETALSTQPEAVL